VAHALIVDDDVDAAMSLKLLVANEQITVAVAATLHEARRQIALQQPDLILVDLQLPDGSGMALFEDEQLVANSEIVLITGHASVETSVQALRLGAADYLVKPINMLWLQGVLSRLMKPATLQAEVADMANQLTKTGHFGPLWGRSVAMRRVHEQISRVAGTGITVLISGESGTGKELVAQTLHTLSYRHKQPFLAVNCGAISPHLIKSEIFGREKGSFTGAERQHLGFFERAAGGTLFLDEVTEMSAELQIKLAGAGDRPLHAGGFHTEPGSRCARGGCHQPRTAAGGGRGEVARRPDTPAQGVSDRGAATARAARRCAAAGSAFCSGTGPAGRPRQAAQRRGPASTGHLPLARQCAGVAQCGAARLCDGGQGGDRRAMAARRSHGLATAFFSPTNHSPLRRDTSHSERNGHAVHRLVYGAGGANHDPGHHGAPLEPPSARCGRPGHQPENAVQPAERLRRAG
jgi:ActR/RegA family two-component response regulator